MKPLIHTPHDLFFKHSLSEPHVAKEFFKSHLPENIRQCINFETITPRKESYIDEKLKVTISDMLFTAQFKGKTGYLYLLNEHLSQPRKLIAFYLMKSMFRIMDDHLKNHSTLPIIYPLIFYTGKKPYHYSTDIFDLFEDAHLAKEILLKPFQLIDVHRIPDEKLMLNTWLGMMELAFKHAHDEKVSGYVKQIISLSKKIKTESGVLYVTATLGYLLCVTNRRNEQEFIEVINENLSEEIGEKAMMTVGEYYARKAFKKGREEEKLSVVRKLLSRKMPLETISEITELSIKELEAHLQKT